jgi:hypothetical protein
VIQRASNLPSIAQAKRIKIIPALHKRLPGAAFSHPAIPQRLNVEILSDAYYEPVLASDWVVDRLVASQAAISADQKAFARHALVEFLLLGHGDIQSQSFDPALCQFNLHIT